MKWWKVKWKKRDPNAQETTELVFGARDQIRECVAKNSGIVAVTSIQILEFEEYEAPVTYDGEC